MNHGYRSSSCLLTCCEEKKPRDNILAYAYSKVNYFISLQKQKRQLRTHRVYVNISHLLVILLTLASDLVLFLYREDRRPLRTRRVVIPCSMRSGWTPSPHSTERYPPVINILLQIILSLTSVEKQFNYKIFINMEYDSYDILCILRS